jgi:hypothetical protein
MLLWVFGRSSEHFAHGGLGKEDLIEIEGIMVQMTLELIYNWLIMERNKLILGNDAENIVAAGRIRLLLLHLKVPTAVPAELTNLSAYVTANDGEIARFPRIFCPNKKRRCTFSRRKIERI